jgi:hypothetical protein
MPKKYQQWQTLSVKNAHIRDKEIEFDEPTHRYTIKGSCEKWISCTGFLHEFFPHFNPDAIIDKMMNSSRWHESKYFGKTRDEIKTMWSSSGKEASEAGTAMHLAIEQHMHGREDVIDPSIFTTKEWIYYKNFWDDCGHDLVPYRSEWEVYSEPHKLAGSIDMVYYRPSDKKYVIYDWKRSKEIKTSNQFEFGYAPLDHLPNTNYWHYTMQLNVYKWFLETYYGLEIGDLYLVILHPDNKNYKRMRLNILSDEVQQMLECRKRAVESDTNLVVILPCSNSIEDDSDEHRKLPTAAAFVD